MNSLPKNPENLSDQAKITSNALTTLETPIGIKQNTKVKFDAGRNLFDTTYDAYKLELSKGTTCTAAVNAATAQGRAFLTRARDTQKKWLGDAPGQKWVAAGWPDDSLAIPSDSATVQKRIESVSKYLVANPTREVEAMDVTQLEADARAAAIATAREGRKTHESALKAAWQTFDAADGAFRLLYHSFIEEVGGLIGSKDTRWIDLGLQMPGYPARPDAPENPRGTALGSGRLRFECDPPPRAEHFQFLWRVKDAAVWERRESTPAPNDFLEGQTPGVIIELKARASNSNGFGPESEIATVTVA
jgi:hypothetical protein